MKHERKSKRLGKRNRVFGNMMELDKFSDSVPSFNLKGDQSIKTELGAFCSIVITIIMLGYALLKFVQLLERKNPNISIYQDEISFGEENPLNLNALNFKAAFRFDSVDPETEEVVSLDDPNFVKLIVKIVGVDSELNYYEKIIPHHKCTEEEYAGFYPI